MELNIYSWILVTEGPRRKVGDTFATCKHGDTMNNPWVGAVLSLCHTYCPSCSMVTDLERQLVVGECGLASNYVAP